MRSQIEIKPFKFPLIIWSSDHTIKLLINDSSLLNLRSWMPELASQTMIVSNELLAIQPFENDTMDVISSSWPSNLPIKDFDSVFHK